MHLATVPCPAMPRGHGSGWGTDAVTVVLIRHLALSVAANVLLTRRSASLRLEVNLTSDEGSVLSAALRMMWFTNPIIRLNRSYTVMFICLGGVRWVEI